MKEIKYTILYGTVSVRTFVIYFITVPVPVIKILFRFRNTAHKRSAKPDGQGRVAVGELEEGTAAMLQHIPPAALPLVDLLASAPHPLVVGEGFGGLDEGGAVGGAHVGSQVLQP
jgi:hypothetical protein